MEKNIYLDNAATTRPFDEVGQIYANFATNFYNPSAVYLPAVQIRREIDGARDKLCNLLGGQNGKIIFTASATEADNLALSTFKPRNNNNLVVFVGEHPAVYNKAKFFEHAGADVRYVDINSSGQADFVEKYVDKNTSFVSIMHVSNETGAINDIANIVNQVKRIAPRAIIHADGVQAFGKIPVNLSQLGVDMYTISAHKIYGPKGIGALWVKNGTNINPIIFGGGQEFGLRSGTENVAGILSFAYCANKVCTDLADNYKKVEKLKIELIDKLKKNNLEFEKNGDGSPYILNLTFEGIRGEVLLHRLEEFGIYISTGSACSSKKPDNRTLKAMKKTDKQIQGTVRISFSPYDNVDINFVADKITEIVKDLQIKIKGK